MSAISTQLRRGTAAFITCGALLGVTHAQGVFVSGSDGTDGAFEPTQDVEILVTKPAYHYTRINIPQGVTVTFQKTANNHPVVWLSQEAVNIAGTVDVAGKAAVGSTGGTGGPGAWNGGNGALAAAGSPDVTLAAKSGQGPGGGLAGLGNNQHGAGAGHATQGQTGTGGTSGGQPYGNNYGLPLLGGSGGAGASFNTGNVVGAGGGGGGGAIRIASSTRITVTGSILARGGDGTRTTNPDTGGTSYDGGGGSGGWIKLMANFMDIGEAATLNARGGATAGSGGVGATGRVRLEAYGRNIGSGAFIQPPASFASPIEFTLPQDFPGIRIASINGQTVTNPAGQPSLPDLTLAESGPVTIVVQGRNIPLGTQPRILLLPTDAPRSEVLGSALDGTFALSTSTAELSFPGGVTQVVVTVSFTPLGRQFTPDGEPIEEVILTASPDGTMETQWVTESGRVLTPGE